MKNLTGATMFGGTGTVVTSIGGNGVGDSSGAGEAMLDDALAGLADELWLERESVDQLLYALTNQLLILRAGSARWLAPADSRIRGAVRALAGCGLRRAVAATSLATALDLPGDATLAELAAAAPVPWDLILADHCDALRALLAEIGTTEADIRSLLAAGAPADEAWSDDDPTLSQAAVQAAYASAERTLAGVTRQPLADFLA